MLLRNSTYVLTLAMILYAGAVYSSPNFTLLKMKCDGTLIKTDHNDSEEIKGKIIAGEVKSGFLAGNSFYTISPNNELFRTDLHTMETDILFNSQSIKLNKLQLWEVIYAEKNTIIFSAYKYEDSNTFKKKAVFDIFQFDLRTKKVIELKLNHNTSGWLSKNKRKIYYSGENNEIFCSENNKIKKLGLDGMRPTISPDGSKLAFIFYGILMEGVYIFDFRTKKVYPLMKFFGPKSVVPKIRWSEDSKLLAIRKNSDLFSTSINIIDVLSLETVKKVKNSNACNWFLK